MRKRKYLVLTIALLTLAILRFTANGYYVGLASASSSASTQNISTLGTISYLTLNATPNLAVIPDNWSLTYGLGPQIIFLDYSVVRTAGQPSIRIEAHTGNDIDTCRECDGTWYNVTPRDHIVATVWIKTSPSSLNDSDYRHGGRIGIDFYAHTSVGYGVVDGCGTPNTHGDPPPAGSYCPTGDCVVNWNTSIWTQVEWNVTVPTAEYTTVQRGGTAQNCAPVQIDSMVLWLDVRPVNDTGLVWFAEATLYINP